MTPRQRVFAEKYAETGNATAAAKAAGYSNKTAYSQGQRLLKNVEVMCYIRSIQDQAASLRLASIVQTKAVLSDILNDDGKKTADRIRAAEILLKTSGALSRPTTDDGGYTVESPADDGGTIFIFPRKDRLPEEEYEDPEADPDNPAYKYTYGDGDDVSDLDIDMPDGYIAIR